jgi:hypothetical protein
VARPWNCSAETRQTTPLGTSAAACASECAASGLALTQRRCPHLVGVDVDARGDRTDPGAVCSAAGDVRYFNKRAEMWGAMKEWINAGCLPDDPDLLAALASVEYAYDGNDAIQLERKVDMKWRGLPSPDDAEALPLTFACPAQR